MKSIQFIFISVIFVAIILFGCSPKDVLPKDSAILLRSNDLVQINRGLSKDKFVLTIPTGAEDAPSGCPNSTSDHCIWICTGTEPLDSIDDETCSTNTWKCPGCGDGGSTVCEDANGNTVPC